MLRNSIVHEGDIQVTMPYVPYREALSWIRGTRRTQVERGEALHADKIVVVFKCKLNVHPAIDHPELSFLRLHGDPARALIPERIRLTRQD
jgi:hypothetical protein